MEPAGLHREWEEQVIAERLHRALAHPATGDDNSGLKPAPRAMPWWSGPALGSISLAISLGMLALAWRIAHPLALLIAAITLAQAMAPLARLGERIVPRVAAILIAYVTIFGTLAAAIALIAPSLAGQAREVAVQAPGLVGLAQSHLDGWGAFPGMSLVELLQANLGNAAGTLVALPLGVASSALELVLTVIMSLYWLIASPQLHAFTLSLFAEEQRPEVTRILERMGKSMGGYLRAMVIGATVIGIVVYVGLLVIGVRYPLVLALMAALGEMVPILGPFLAAVPSLLVALLQSPGQALAVLIFFVVIQQFESHLLIPNLMSNQANIPPALAIFALMAGASVGGILGALVAIPLAGAIQVLVEEVVAPAIRAHHGNEPTTVEPGRGETDEESPAAEPVGAQVA
jgi:putative heme transporter